MDPNPAEARRRWEESIRESIKERPKDGDSYSTENVKYRIEQHRREAANGEKLLKNPRPTNECGGRPGFELCVRATVGADVAKAKANLCRYETLLAAIQGTSATNSTQSQQSRESRQSPQSSNTPEQQMTQQAAAEARETQAKGDADAKRQGRRRHDPAMEANDCISIDTSKPGFALFRNSCNFKVEVAWCNENPKKDSWADVHNCVGKGGQMTGVRANGESASHIKNTERVHWLACKEPALTLEVTFDGTQLQGRCRVLFAN